MSVRELSQRVGVSARQVSRYEAGEQEPSWSTGVRIACALGVPWASLYVHDTDAATPDEPRGVPGTANTEARAAVSPDSTARAR